MEGLKFQLNSVLKILHFSGDIRGAKTSCISCALRYNSNSLFFRRSLGFTSVFSESRLFDLTNPYGNFAPFSAASLSSKAEPHDFFMVIWGSYLALNTWALKIFPLFTKLPRLPSLMQTTAELYELTGLHLNGGSFTFSRLVYASDYLQKQFTTLNSFLAFSASLLRSALFDATLGLYAKSFFMRNLALQKNSYKFVRVAFNRSANLLSRTYVDNFFSFAASQYFPRYLVSSLSSSSSACLPNLLSVSGFHPYRKVTSYLLKDLMFGALFFGLSSPKVFKHFELRNGVFYHAKTRILRSKFSRYRLSSLRTPVAVSANRVLLNWKSIAFRKLCRLYAVTEVKSAAAKAVPISLLSKNRSAFYLKSVLRLLHRFNTQDRPSTTFGLQFSLGSYSLRVNRFFNIMRAVPPLRVLTYAKKIGIWPRNLRLRPKKAKPKRVLEINISKNKQSLVPDKNFKMPPSIFSRENYESMNLIWDFPHDDYKFARVNMTK